MANLYTISTLCFENWKLLQHLGIYSLADLPIAALELLEVVLYMGFVLVATKVQYFHQDASLRFINKVSSFLNTYDSNFTNMVAFFQKRSVSKCMYVLILISAF